MLLRGLNLADYESSEATDNVDNTDFNDLIEIAEKWLDTSNDIN